MPCPCRSSTFNKDERPEHRKWRRVHGLQFPIHPLQVLAWVIVLIISVWMCGSLIPALNFYLEVPFQATFCFILLVHLMTHAMATLVDPADPELRKRKEQIMVPEFDRSKHLHVIEDGRCHLCNISICSSRTKHCSVCNKCVDRFDHHCKWLNHCVGKRNYVIFLICIISALFGTLCVAALALAEIIMFYKKSVFLDYWGTESRQFTCLYVELSPEVFIAIAAVSVVLSLIACGLLAHLIGFHMYIMNQRLTTYEYIRGMKNGKRTASATKCFNEEGIRRLSDSQDLKKPKSCCLATWVQVKPANLKGNQIAPQNGHINMASLDYDTGEGSEVEVSHEKMNNNSVVVTSPKTNNHITYVKTVSLVNEELPTKELQETPKQKGTQVTKASTVPTLPKIETSVRQTKSPTPASTLAPPEFPELGNLEELRDDEDETAAWSSAVAPFERTRSGIKKLSLSPLLSPIKESEDSPKKETMVVAFSNSARSDYLKNTDKQKSATSGNISPATVGRTSPVSVGRTSPIGMGRVSPVAGRSSPVMDHSGPTTIDRPSPRRTSVNTKEVFPTLHSPDLPEVAVHL